ncbi:hypothetical protein [Sandarakinorhabdus limnophila]|uniref:hypothetical protein n=1 Tax=Sandarakinorhabdus limnophila TaxID=210512 RepID=UPI0026EF499D|nr:hypothetical protein [Sandarakinorhabdus limnophila]
MRTLLLSALLLTAPVAAAPFSFSAARIGDDVETLASDAFAGRGPGEVGEAQTLAFLAARLQAAGLEPAGPQGSWLHSVPLIRLDRAPGAALSVQMNGTKPLIKLVFLCPNIHPYPLVKRLPLPKYALPCPATPSRKGWTIWWMENAGNESAIGSGYQDGNGWQAL